MSNTARTRNRRQLARRQLISIRRKVTSSRNRALRANDRPGVKDGPGKWRRAGRIDAFDWVLELIAGVLGEPFKPHPRYQKHLVKGA